MTASLNLGMYAIEVKIAGFDICCLSAVYNKIGHDNIPHVKI